MSSESLLCCLVVVVVLFFIWKINNTPTKKIKRDPAVQKILQFFRAAYSMPRQSTYYGLALVIKADDEEPLQCHYWDTYKSSSSVDGPTDLYNEKILEALLIKKNFPKYTFIDVDMHRPFGYKLNNDFKAAYPHLLDQYITVIAEECRKCGIPLIEEECTATNLRISLPNDLGDKK